MTFKAARTRGSNSALLLSSFERTRAISPMLRRSYSKDSRILKASAEKDSPCVSGITRPLVTMAFSPTLSSRLS